MPDYTIRHRYHAYRDGQQYGPWVEGDRVQLAEADADWVNRDSPGALVEIEAKAPAKPPAEEKAPAAGKPPAANRRARPARDRSAK